MKKYLLGTSAFSNPELLEKCLKSWPDYLNRIVVFDRLIPTSELFEFHKEFAENYPDFYGFSTEEHVGVSGTWNAIIVFAFERDYDAVIIVGSDTEFVDDYLEKWIEEFEKGNYQFATSKEQGFNCFGITRECFDKVGTFDENYFPAYFEDNDYWHRVKISGYDVGDLGDPTKFNHWGSATIRNNEWYNRANAYSYGINERYYRAKWGGHQDAPPESKYQHPFDKPELSPRFWQPFPEIINAKKEVWANAHKHSLE